MQERGGLVKDEQGFWITGSAFELGNFTSAS
jgi:hypothetical protein